MSEPERPELADTVAGGDLQRTLADSAARPARSTDLARGALVGRYLVLGALGSGGMGVVYAAYDPELDRKVALKLVRQRSADGQARMLREAQAIARLSHPNVVAIHDVGTDADQQVFIAMELVDGETLTRWVRERPRTTGELVDLFVQAGRGLAAAHRAGLVHRDFKPDNVLVGRDGRPRVVDFGLVREVHHVEPSDTVRDASAAPPALATPLTQAGAIIGTPYYMAPEQFLERATDARTDQYSFCASLYEVLGDRVPFQGTSVGEIAEQVLAGNPPELSASRKVPAHVRAAIRRGMSVSPTARFPTMEALLAELGRDPGATRRRWAIAAGGVAVVALAVAVPWLARSPDEAVHCGDGTERLAGAWDGGRRQALERTFAATGTPFAASEAATVTRALDSYAAAWAHSYEDSCRATHVRGEQSVEMLDLRSACLARHRTELAAAVELLTAADAAAVERAHVSVAALSPVADCDDLGALQAPIKPPADLVVRRAITDLRDELSRVEAAVGAANYAKAVPRAEALLVQARALGYRPIEAEAAMAVGYAKSEAGDEAGAQAVLIAAFGAALESGHEHIANESALALSQLLARSHEALRARDWLAIAEASIARSGTVGTQQAVVEYSRALLLVNEGKYAAAAAAYERADAIQQRVEPNSPAHSHTLNGLAHMYDELGRYAEARAVGERSLALQQAELGQWHPQVAQVLINLGNIADDEGDVDRAKDYYTRALAIHERAGAASTGLADVLNNLGNLEFDRGDYDAGLRYYERTLALRETLDPGGLGVAMALNNIGSVARLKGDCTQALASHQRALRITEKVARDHPYAGDALEGIGECKVSQHAYAEAEVALERALAIRKAGARPLELAEVEFSLAKALWERGQRDRARVLARAAHDALVAEPANKDTLATYDDWLKTHVM